MKIQQISRFRLGEQGMDAGYQISGASAQVDSIMESEFTGMYTTLEIGSEPGTLLPYILDGGYNMDGSRFYMSRIYAEKDFKGRPTPYVHGLIFDREQMETCFSKPEDFFRFSSENFRNFCNPQQQNKEKLPEIDELKKDDIPLLTIQAVREKYRLTDEVYEDLLRHFYEAVFSERMITLAFGWNQTMASFEEVMKDMMFLAFSSMPSVLRSKITFSNYQVKGMSSRMFTIVPEKCCEKHEGAWFNLANGRSSQLREDVEGTRFKTQFITYLVKNSEEERKNFLNYVNEYLTSIYRHPEMKRMTAIANSMVLAFYAYGYERFIQHQDEKILEIYYKPTNAGRILSSLTRIKVDEPEYISELLSVLLERAVRMDVRINDVQFKNLQKYYLETDSEQYGKAFIAALATRDQDTVKELFVESLKTESSLKTDNFIAGLLRKIPDQQEILTDEVIQEIADRYPVTESEELQDFYLNYINNLYTDTMEKEDVSKLVKKALKFIKDNQQESSYERMALYLERQLEQLVKYRLRLEKTVLDQLLRVCLTYSNDYDIENCALEYYMQVYMNGDIEVAVEYYGHLQKSDSKIVEAVSQRLRDAKSRVQDEYYCHKELPRIRRTLKEARDYMEQTQIILEFPVHEKSMEAIVDDFIEKSEAYLKENCEDEADSRRGSENHRKRTGHSKEGLDNNVLYLRYRELKDSTLDIFGEGENSERILEYLLNVYWESVNVNTISPKFYRENFEQIKCGHEKCRKQERYHQTLIEFSESLSKEPEYHPSVDMLIVLTTKEYVNCIEMTDEWVKRVIEKSNVSDFDMSVDVLLMKYYDFAKKSLKNTEFIKKLTEDQRYELSEQTYNLSVTHPEVFDKLQRYLNSKKKEKQKKVEVQEKVENQRKVGTPKKLKSEKEVKTRKKGVKVFQRKKVFFLLGIGVLLILIIIVVQLVILITGKNKENIQPIDGSVIQKEFTVENIVKDFPDEVMGVSDGDSSSSGSFLEGIEE